MGRGVKKARCGPVSGAPPRSTGMTGTGDRNRWLQATGCGAAVVYYESLKRALKRPLVSPFFLDWSRYSFFLFSFKSEKDARLLKSYILEVLKFQNSSKRRKKKGAILFTLPTSNIAPPTSKTSFGQIRGCHIILQDAIIVSIAQKASNRRQLCRIR